MPVHIEDMQTEVTVFDGDLPLSPPQIEKLVKIVLQRLEEKQRNARNNSQATEIRNSIVPKDGLTWTA
jgi:hypothetical protein